MHLREPERRKFGVPPPFFLFVYFASFVYGSCLLLLLYTCILVLNDQTIIENKTRDEWPSMFFCYLSPGTMFKPMQGAFEKETMGRESVKM